MWEDQNQKNMGEQIKDALADALQNGDFKNLNDLVSQTVTDTLNEVGKQIMKGAGSPEDIPLWKQREREKKGQEERRRQEQAVRQEERRRQEQAGRQEERKRQEERRRQEQAVRQEQSACQGQPQRGSSMYLPAVRKRNVGKVPGILYQVFGGIGIGVTGLVMWGQLFLLLTGTVSSLRGLFMDLAFLAAFAGMIGVGIGKIKRIKRADRYIDLCGSKMYEDIEKLARGTDKSARYVKRDLKKMLQAGMFPQGHLDGQGTCFMLDDAVYGQYLELEESRKRRAEEERETAAGSVPPGRETDDQAPQDARESELNAMISEGMNCIHRLRDLNDNIEGEVISGKLSRLEDLLKEIFDSVREHPEQMDRMHKLMEYYLPTTLKLVEAYEEFDGISVPGEEVIQAKAEIEKTLDTINEAFAELLNNLFQDAVFDATTDAQVLKSMLAKEGLTREMDFSGKGREKQ